MISIAEAKRIREELGMTHIIIIGVDKDNKQHVATYGETEGNAIEAAKAGNYLKKSLGWPEELCNAVPLERKCENCTYYKPDYGMHCMNGWTGNGSNGDCMFEPQKIRVLAVDKCSHFCPK